MPLSGNFKFCQQPKDAIEHILINCVMIAKIWQKVFRKENITNCHALYRRKTATLFLQEKNSAQNLLVSFCCVLGKDTEGHFPLFDDFAIHIYID